MGKLIVIEGSCDGVGKSTQYRMLIDRLKEEKEKKNIKIIATIVGLMFIDTFIFIYFGYAFLIRFDKAIIIAIENYFIKSIIMIIYVFIINKILSVKKVK